MKVRVPCGAENAIERRSAEGTNGMSSAGLTYDTGALVAAERDDRMLWSLHRAASRRGSPPTVPAARGLARRPAGEPVETPEGL